MDFDYVWRNHWPRSWMLYQCLPLLYRWYWMDSLTYTVDHTSYKHHFLLLLCSNRLRESFEPPVWPRISEIDPSGPKWRGKNGYVLRSVSYVIHPFHQTLSTNCDWNRFPLIDNLYRSIKQTLFIGSTKIARVEIGVHSSSPSNVRT